jgi:hypothetical protein
VNVGEEGHNNVVPGVETDMGHEQGEGDAPLLVLKQTQTREKEGDPLLLALKRV